jgi:hypothetical protein
MFRTSPVTDPTSVDVVDRAELIPLSVLALDLPEPPTSGWDVYLTGRGITVLTDDIGRPAIARADARQLLDEHRENEARRQEVAQPQEQQAIEADQRFRAQLPSGLPWFDIPAGVTAAELWAQHEKDSRPRRRSVLEDALANEGTILRSLAPEPDQS